MPVDEKSGLFYEEYGTTSSPALVFLHAGGVAGWMWRYQIEFFRARYHVLVPDLPQQGQSVNSRPFSVENAADAVADFIRSQAAGKAHVVGLSEGAVVTVALLARHPEVIDRAVCSSAILKELPGAWMYTPAMFKWMYRWFIAPFKNNDGWIRLNMKYSAGVGEEFYPEFKRSFQETTEAGFTSLMYDATHYRLPAGLEKANVPVLVVVGKLEYKQMIESGRELVSHLLKGHGVMVSLGQGSSLAKEHNWAMTAPERFNETVSAWIEDRALPETLLPLNN